MKPYSELIISRLQQLTSYIQTANEHTYINHIREFCRYCEITSMLHFTIDQLPIHPYEWLKTWDKIEWPLGDRSVAFRWSCLKQLINVNKPNEILNYFARIVPELPDAQKIYTQEVVIPFSDYLIYSIETTNMMLYLLLKYKRWAEWFEAERLRNIYVKEDEKGLDQDLRRFLFENGINYPYSDPRSPGGQADVVAELDTNDPLVLEIKIWDSKKNYKHNRLCDGLRQVIDYTTKYGKEIGYVVVFNFDTNPIQFIGDNDYSEGFACIKREQFYYFISVHITKQEYPISQKDKGKPVKAIEIRLSDLWDNRNS